MREHKSLFQSVHFPLELEGNWKLAYDLSRILQKYLKQDLDDIEWRKMIQVADPK